MNRRINNDPHGFAHTAREFRAVLDSCDTATLMRVNDLLFKHKSSVKALQEIHDLGDENLAWIITTSMGMGLRAEAEARIQEGKMTYEELISFPRNV